MTELNIGNKKMNYNKTKPLTMREYFGNKKIKLPKSFRERLQEQVNRESWILSDRQQEPTPKYEKQSLSTRCKTGMYNFIKHLKPSKYFP